MIKIKTKYLNIIYLMNKIKNQYNKVLVEVDWDRF